MNNFALALEKETNATFTENGAISYKSTLDSCLDFFAKIGSMRTLDKDSKYRAFLTAYKEDALTALRILFYGRDIRGGLGERDTFRHIIREFAMNHANELRPNVKYIPYFGRWDDLYCLVGTPVEDEVINVIKNESASGDENSLMYKWLASVNASSQETNRYGRWTARKVFGDAQDNAYFKTYRTLLKNGREKVNVVEQKMSRKEWGDVDYKRLTSYNMLRYLKAFYRHDSDRFAEEFFKFVKADTLFPYDILNKVHDNMADPKNYPTADMYSKFWENLPDITQGNSVNTIVVADTSGSMECQLTENSKTRPIDIALSLAIYFAERLNGDFKNRFINFSDAPCYQKLIGDNLRQKLQSIDYSNWSMNTNVEAVFDMILKTGQNSKIADEDMPKRLLIISDMEFDDCARARSRRGRQYTFIESMKEKYAEVGYTFPQLIFWNCGRSGSFHMTVDDNGFIVVSGASQRAFEAILRGETIVEEVVTKTVVEDGVRKEITQTQKSVKIDPISAMLNTVHSDRYQIINV